MIMGQSLRKLALTCHVASSVGSLGAVAGFLALAVTGLTSPKGEVVRAVYLAMDVIARIVVVPIVLASLLTGLVQSLGTRWGLFQHYWVLVKLLITVLAIVVLLLQMQAISYVADAAARSALSPTDLRATRLSLVVHSAGGLLVLLVPMFLSIYKPRGLTPYGMRKQAH